MTDKQKVFVKEYLVDLNATQAAVRAGYSEKSARKIAHKLVQKPEIKGEIQRAMDTRSSELDISCDTVMTELLKIAVAPASDSPGAELKFSSKLKALELMGKRLGMFDAKQESDNVIRVVFDGGEGYAD